MTVLDSIKAMSSYEVPDSTATVIIVKRGLKTTDEASETVLNSKSFELACADLYKWLVSPASIAEGGYRVSLKDSSDMKTLASDIYRKYGERDPFIKVTTVRNGSQRW